MKVTIPIGLVLIIAALAYVLGTESGRAQREVIMVKFGRVGSGDDDTAEPDAAD